MTETSTADLLAAIAIVDELAASVEHLHPSYTTQRDALRWLREHAAQIGTDRDLGKRLAGFVGEPLTSAGIDTVALGCAVRAAVGAAGGRIEYGEGGNTAEPKRDVYDEIRDMRASGLGQLREVAAPELVAAALNWASTPGPDRRTNLVTAAALLVAAIEACDE